MTLMNSFWKPHKFTHCWLWNVKFIMRRKHRWAIKCQRKVKLCACVAVRQAVLLNVFTHRKIYRCLNAVQMIVFLCVFNARYASNSKQSRSWEKRIELEKLEIISSLSRSIRLQQEPFIFYVGNVFGIINMIAPMGYIIHRGKCWLRASQKLYIVKVPV